MFLISVDVVVDEVRYLFVPQDVRVKILTKVIKFLILMFWVL